MRAGFPSAAAFSPSPFPSPLARCAPPAGSSATVRGRGEDVRRGKVTARNAVLGDGDGGGSDSGGQNWRVLGAVAAQCSLNTAFFSASQGTVKRGGEKRAGVPISLPAAPALPPPVAKAALFPYLLTKCARTPPPTKARNLLKCLLLPSCTSSPPT